MKQKSSTTSNDARKIKAANQTNENRIKTSQKNKFSSTVTSDASKSCEVTDNDTAVVMIIPEIKTSPKDHHSSSLKLSKKDFKDVKVKKERGDASDSVVVKIPKLEQKWIKNEPSLDQVRLFSLLNILYLIFLTFFV